jgi:hypothetical protein
MILLAIGGVVMIILGLVAWFAITAARNNKG